MDELWDVTSSEAAEAVCTAMCNGAKTIYACIADSETLAELHELETCNTDL